MKLTYSFRNISRQLTEADIRDFELSRGATLPEAYRSFLLTTNGGYPDHQVYEYGDDGSFVLQRLYPLTEEAEPYFNLRSVNHPTADFPAELITIGGSICGDDLCIGIAEPHRDQIFYLDHEERDPDETEENPWLGARKLSDHFEDFMLALTKL